MLNTIDWDDFSASVWVIEGHDRSKEIKALMEARGYRCAGGVFSWWGGLGCVLLQEWQAQPLLVTPENLKQMQLSLAPENRNQLTVLTPHRFHGQVVRNLWFTHRDFKPSKMPKGAVRGGGPMGCDLRLSVDAVRL